MFVPSYYRLGFTSMFLWRIGGIPQTAIIKQKVQSRVPMTLIRPHKLEIYICARRWPIDHIRTWDMRRWPIIISRLYRETFFCFLWTDANYLVICMFIHLHVRVSVIELFFFCLDFLHCLLVLLLVESIFPHLWTRMNKLSCAINL